METDSHNTVSSEKSFFNAISVVDIDVDVQYSRKDFQQFQDADNDVIDIAKPISLSFLRVMEAATPVNCDVRGVVYYQMSCINRTT